MTPSRDLTDGDDPAPSVLSDVVLQLWALALLIAQFTLTCWWFSRMYA